MSCPGRLAFLLLFLTLSVPFAAARDAPDAYHTKHKSTTGAVLRSLVLPGWGQFYNDSYYKAVAFALIEGIQISGIYGFHNKMLKAKRQDNHPELQRSRAAYMAALRPGDFQNEQRYRERRNKTLWWFTGIVLLSLGDAYVDAQLYGIDISKPNIQPRADCGGHGIY
jgi:hypothetical protein